ncbi:MAG: hypothetical protein B7Y88_00355 [Sphingomonadales bacterium 32-64-17]|nr:MAG: hypothetical protein B7Y88_00355 [Sphingomonadales bacterium 32-64-17]
MSLTRRNLIAGGALVGSLAAAPAWSVSSDLSRGSFTHGLASGDPLPEAVILWTRFVAEGQAFAVLRWEVSEYEDFRSIAASGETSTTGAQDWCVKVDASGLKPDGRYFYRFVSASGASPTGRTRTAPLRGREPLTVAGFACSNLTMGHFRAYADAAARDDIDLCVHVGDYIYEGAMSSARRSPDHVAGREWLPDRELVIYTDYCQRYASYRADPDLQELHRVKPFVVVWDDHEFANDAWREGAQAHQHLSEGSWKVRYQAAARAWFDWMPVRVHPGQPYRIHHRLQWGELAHITMLDTRLLRDNQPLNFATHLAGYAEAGDATFAREALRIWHEVMGASDRSVLGFEQERWLDRQLAQSRESGAVWQILVEGSVLGRWGMPAEGIDWLPAEASDAERLQRLIEVRAGALGLPYDTPLWNGFPTARERLLASCAREGRNVFAFGGETHTGWYFDLPGGHDGPAAVEAALTAVTSSNSLRTADRTSRDRAESLIAFNPELAWCDVNHWGYTVVRFTPIAAEAEHVGFASIADPLAPVALRQRLVAEAGRTGVRPWQLA